jgi:hypothetical protein
MHVCGGAVARSGVDTRSRTWAREPAASTYRAFLCCTILLAIAAMTDELVRCAVHCACRYGPYAVRASIFFRGSLERQFCFRPLWLL